MSGSFADARGDARVGKPKCVSSLLVADGCVFAAMILSSPPQSGQAARSLLYTRLSKRDQVIRLDSRRTISAHSVPLLDRSAQSTRASARSALTHRGPPILRYGAGLLVGLFRRGIAAFRSKSVFRISVLINVVDNFCAPAGFLPDRESRSCKSRRGRNSCSHKKQTHSNRCG